jgi:hypothetical protein
MAHYGEIQKIMNKFILINTNTKEPIFEYVINNKDNFITYINNGKLLMPFTKEPSYITKNDVYEDEFTSIEYPTKKVYRQVEYDDIKKALIYCVNDLMIYNNNKPIPFVHNGMIYKFNVNAIYQSITILSIMDQTSVMDIYGKVISVNKTMINDIIHNINNRIKNNETIKKGIINKINDTNTINELLSIDIIDVWS